MSKLLMPERRALLPQILSPLAINLGGPQPKIVIRPDGELESLVRGGAVTATGMFATNWVQTFTGGSPILNWDTTHQRHALFPNTITPDFDATTANASYNAGQYLAANEITGTNYSAGGAGDASTGGTIGTPSVVNTAGVLAFSFGANTTWANATITNARCALLYDNSLTPKSAFVLVSFGADYSTSPGGTFTIQWAAGGVISMTVHA